MLGLDPGLLYERLPDFPVIPPLGEARERFVKQIKLYGRGFWRIFEDHGDAPGISETSSRRAARRTPLVCEKDE